MSKWKKALPILALGSLSYWLFKQRKRNYKPLDLTKINELYDFWKTKYPFVEEIKEDPNIGILYQKHEHLKYNESSLDYYLEAKDYLKQIEMNKYGKEAKKATVQDYVFIYENDGILGNLSLIHENTILNLTTFNQKLFNQCLEDLINFYSPNWK